MPNPRREARAFARRAELNRPYYYASGYRLASDISQGSTTRLLTEITFTRRSPFGPMHGPHSAAYMWLNHGPLYTDRNHPDIRGLQTLTEYEEEGEKFAAQFLADGEPDAMADQAAHGTAFRSGHPRHWN